MISFIKKHANWITVASHSFVLFFAMFLVIMNIAISGWILMLFASYVIWIAYSYSKKTKTFKKWCSHFKINK